MRWPAGDWMRRSLQADLGRSAVSPRPQLGFNPHPRGVMQEDGCSYLLLRLLVAHPRTWFTQGELQRRLRRSRMAVSWALQYLIKRELIVTADDSRNPRYLRYRLAVDTPVALPPSSSPAGADPEQPGPKQVPMDFKF